MSKEVKTLGKILSILLGTMFTVIGILLLIRWWTPFIVVTKAVAPVFLIVCGIVALIAGIAEIRDHLNFKKEELNQGENS